MDTAALLERIRDLGGRKAGKEDHSQHRRAEAVYVN